MRCLFRQSPAAGSGSPPPPSGSGANFHPKLIFLAPLGDDVNEPIALLAGQVNIFSATVVAGHDGGYARSFAGSSSSYITFFATQSASRILVTINSGAPFTFMAWIYPTTLRQGYVADFVQSRFRLEADGSFTYLNGATVTAQSVAGVITAGAWQHIAVTSTGAAGGYAMYVNGSSVGLATNGAAPGYLGLEQTTATSGNDPRIGYTFAGYIDDIRVYSASLSATEVATEKDKTYR